MFLNESAVKFCNRIGNLKTNEKYCVSIAFSFSFPLVCSITDISVFLEGAADLISVNGAAFKE